MFTQIAKCVAVIVAVSAISAPAFADVYMHKRIHTPNPDKAADVYIPRKLADVYIPRKFADVYIPRKFADVYTPRKFEKFAVLYPIIRFA